MPLKIWEGGLSIYGGILGGIVAVLVYSAYKKQNFFNVTDVIAPTLILGQAIGRWGNFVNQEVYGFEITNKAWQWFPVGVKIKDAFGNVSWHLANFFYESVLDLAGFFILLAILRKSKEKGIVTFAYVFYYGFIRIFLEFLREDAYILRVPGTNIPASALVSGLFIASGLAGFIYIIIKNKLKQKKS